MDFTATDLDYMLYLWIDDKKVVRVLCNFLLNDPVRVIDQYIHQDGEQDFYTHVSIEYQARQIFKSEIPKPGTPCLFPL